MLNLDSTTRSVTLECGIVQLMQDRNDLLTVGSIVRCRVHDRDARVTSIDDEPGD